jgi:hypothetical protein
MDGGNAGYAGAIISQWIRQRINSVGDRLWFIEQRVLAKRQNKRNQHGAQWVSLHYD